MFLSTLLTARTNASAENSRAQAQLELEVIFPKNEWGIKIDINKYTDENIQNLWGRQLRAEVKRALDAAGLPVAAFKDWLGDTQFVNIAIYSNNFFLEDYRSNTGWRISIFSLPRAGAVIIGISSHYQNAQDHNKLCEASNLLFQVIQESKQTGISPDFDGRAISSADWNYSGLIENPVSSIAGASIFPLTLMLKEIRTTTVKKTLASFISLSVISVADIPTKLTARLSEVKRLAEHLLAGVYPFTSLEEFENFRSLALQDTAAAQSRLMLRQSKNSRSTMRIFYGPPGTGKTLSAVRLAVTLADSSFQASADSRSAFERFNELRNQCAFVTFHPSLQYEDLVESIRPAIEDYQENTDTGTPLSSSESDTDGNQAEAGSEPGIDGRSLRYKLHEGPLLRLARRALREPGKEFVVVVDEINRGDLSRILGPLISSLDIDKRLGADFPIGVELMYPRAVELESRLFLPSNLHIVGTMNSADRNIALVDHALRRRFEFIEVPPEPALLSAPAGDLTLDCRQLLAVINSRIEHLLDSDHRVGHGYLMSCKTDRDVIAGFAKNVIPLLREYFYGNEGLVLLILSEVLDTETKIFILEPASVDFSSAFGIEQDLAMDFGYRPGTGARILRFDERFWSSNNVVSGPNNLDYAVASLRKIYQVPLVHEVGTAAAIEQS